MKNITEVIKSLSKERHDNVKQLVDNILTKCIKLGLTKTKNGNDVSYEIIKRRYYRLLEENSELPDLILIDGGKGQLSAAMKSL